MRQRNEMSFPLLGFVSGIIAIACNFLSGFLLGLLAPIAAIAAIVAGVRFLTGRVPFLGAISEDEEGGRQLSLQLVSPEEARELYYGHKEQLGGQLVWMKDEIQTIVQEARVETEAEASEQSLELHTEA